MSEHTVDVFRSCNGNSSLGGERNGGTHTFLVHDPEQAAEQQQQPSSYINTLILQLEYSKLASGRYKSQQVHKLSSPHSSRTCLR